LAERQASSDLKTAQHIKRRARDRVGLRLRPKAAIPSTTAVARGQQGLQTKTAGLCSPAQTADKPVDIFGGFVFWTLVVLVGF
jgi:hypothetical protein